MERGYSVVSDLPPGYSPDFVPFLFNQQEHLCLQGSGWVTLYLVQKSRHMILAQASFNISNHRAISPARAPFGSFEFSSSLSAQNLYAFIQETLVRLNDWGVRSVLITEPPLSYRNSGELFHTLLLNLGFNVMKAEISSGISVRKNGFEEGIQAWEKRKLRQAKAKGLHYKTIPGSDLANVYAFLLKCRHQRGHSLSMSLEDLSKTVEAFRHSFFMFGVFHQSEMAAAAICIQVHPRILYTFYFGHLKKFDSLSPVVLLTSGIFKFCESKKIELLDLGTSASNGQPNFSLLDFKLSLGAVPSMKVTYEKLLT